MSNYMLCGGSMMIAKGQASNWQFTVIKTK